MRAVLPASRRQDSRRPLRAILLHLEALEPRSLLAPLAGPLLPVVEVEPNDTLDQAQDLGDLSALQQVKVDGAVGRGTSAAADVDWYRFRLDRPSAVSIAARSDRLPNPLVSVLSLYGMSVPAGNRLPGRVGYRLLTQDDGANHDGDARLERLLAAGTYFVAVSGSGNRYFHPLIAGSGFPGSSGNYELVVAAADLGLGPTSGPAVLATDPAAGTDPASSPFVIRIDLSTALDPSSIRLGSAVQLRYAAGAALGDTSQAVRLASWYFDPIADELQLTPAAPLWPGSYQLFLAGQRNAGRPVLLDPYGNPLGKSDLHPSGADFSFSFQISGIKGNRAANAGADDTPATAQNLGALAGGSLVQVAGAIGDDPTNPIPFSPADVDLYHFHLQGAGRFAFTAEVFAGRIGSALDPALSLFRLDPSDQRLYFVASNDNSFNPTLTHDGSAAPLFTDPVLNAGLTEGDYYLAVSASTNVPMPAFGLLPGSKGIFDPTVTHSGKNGFTIGPYVLAVAAQPMNDPPHVRAVLTREGAGLGPGAVLPAPPTGLSLIFDKPVNLQELVRQTGLSQVAAIYIEDSHGGKFYPRYVSSTASANRADFVLEDALPNGVYYLHLSGPLGLTDLAGNPLIGNDPSGDFVVGFTVNGAARGSNGNPRLWLDKEPNDDPAHPQELGVLFPAELQAGVVLERPGQADAADTADFYRVQIVQQTLISFGLLSFFPSAGIRLSLSDASGKAIAPAESGSGAFWHAAAALAPGSYLLGIFGWSGAMAPRVSYRLSMVGFSPEQAPALSVGPGPAIRIRHVAGGPLAAMEPPLPNGSGAAAGAAPGGLLQLGAIPSDAFLLLAAGPIGAPGGSAPAPSALYERILARTPEQLVSEAIARLPFLIAAQHSGTQEGPLLQGEFLGWLQTLLQKWDQASWSKALELLYRSGEWLEKAYLRPRNGLLEELPEGDRHEDAQTEEKSASESTLNHVEIFAEAPSLLWAMLTTLAVSAPREPDRSHALQDCWR